MILTRRSLMQLAPWSLLYGYGDKDFWNTKDPDNWSSDEVARLLKKSPWAKEIAGQRTTTIKNGPMTTDPIGAPLPNPTSRNRNPAPPRMPKQSSQKMVTTYKGIVVWESAKVVRDGAKWQLPDGFEGQYVLSVTGIPLAKTSSKSALDAVRQVTMLQAKGQDPLEAAILRQKRDNGAVYFMGFSKEALPISADDKEVVFTTHMGKVAFTARFNPREMLYHGELAL